MAFATRRDGKMYMPTHYTCINCNCKFPSSEFDHDKQMCKTCLKANANPVADVLCNVGLSDALDTGDLVNDPLYKALDKLYERGWVDRNKGQDYDPRGTEEWQSVLDLFRLQKGR
jgi:hypothetical protein